MEDYKTEERALRKLISVLKKILCLVDDEDQYNLELCIVLWSALKGCPCYRHEMTKSGVESDYPAALKTMIDYIFKYLKYMVSASAIIVRLKIIILVGIPIRHLK